MKEKSGRGTSTPRLAEIFSDSPKLDGVLSFEFDQLADTLAQLALNPSNTTPFSIVVKGGWGHGKTTLMRRARERLGPLHKELSEGGGKVRHVKSIWFNAWKYPSEDTLLSGLFREMLHEMARGGLLDQAKAVVAEHKNLVAFFGRSFASWFTGSEELGKPESWQSRFYQIEQQRALYDEFQRAFDELWLTWMTKTGVARDLAHTDMRRKIGELSNQHVLAIFLDDLDRCPTKRIVETLEAINLFFDQPGVCFYLGVDWPRLLDVLRHRFDDERLREQFVEKIVQVGFDIPDVSLKGASEYVAELIKDSSMRTVFAGATFAELFSEVVHPKSPRHIKRVLNDLAIRLAVLRSSGRIGGGEKQLEESAVAAWHLLLEASEPSAAREARSSLDAFGTFLGQWLEFTKDRAQASAGALGVVSATIRTKLRDDALPKLSRLATSLKELRTNQRTSLIHFGSPHVPKAEARAVIESARHFDPFRLDLDLDPYRSSRHIDLFRLDSGAWVKQDGGWFHQGEMAADKDEPNCELSPYWISKYPITNQEYFAFTTATNYEPPQHWLDGRPPEGFEQHPVVYVGWDDAFRFAMWLHERMGSGQQSGRVALPSESQWEFAASGKASRQYPWGSEEPTDERANFGDPKRGTTPVGKYLSGATPEGVLDLAGNVWEWCFDWYADYPKKRRKDYEGPGKGAERIVRGGAFLSDPHLLRSLFRDFRHPAIRGSALGFRVVWLSSGVPARP